MRLFLICLLAEALVFAQKELTPAVVAVSSSSEWRPVTVTSLSNGVHGFMSGTILKAGWVLAPLRGIVQNREIKVATYKIAESDAQVIAWDLGSQLVLLHKDGVGKGMLPWSFPVSTTVRVRDVVQCAQHVGVVLVTDPSFFGLGIENIAEKFGSPVYSTNPPRVFKGIMVRSGDVLSPRILVSSNTGNLVVNSLLYKGVGIVVTNAAIANFLGRVRVLGLDVKSQLTRTEQ